MQGLRARTVQQDENHGQTFLGAKSYADNLPENAPGSVRATPMAGMPLNRRALGNITNRGLNNSNIHTEKTPLQRPGATKGLGNPEVGSTKPSRTKAQPDTQTAQNADRIAALAADGVEKLYGKGWEELERDREFREDEEILQRVSAMASVGLPTYFPLWIFQTLAQDKAVKDVLNRGPRSFDKEEVVAMLPSPVKLKSPPREEADDTWEMEQDFEQVLPKAGSWEDFA